MYENRLNIAILSINIGDYFVFWNRFYTSAEKNLFPEAHKKYFVFTNNSTMLEKTVSDNVQFIQQEDLGWPFNTMKRFRMFTKIVEELRGFDYVFFANANALFVKKLSTSIIHTNKEYIVVEHPGFHFVADDEKPFERRKKSRAFVDVTRGKYYVQGAFYGAKSASFIEMTEELDRLTEIDLGNDIVAVWHDESFLNMFVAKNIDKTQVLGWQYLYFEEMYFPFRPIILLRDKRKFLTNKNARFKGQNYLLHYFLIFLRNVKWRVLTAMKIIKWQENITKIQSYVDTDITEHRAVK